MTVEMSEQDTEKQRKRLIFRSWHRGTREMDLLMGSFADKFVSGFPQADLDLYDEILNHSDPDLYNWITGKEDVPANYMNPVMEKLVAHSFSAS
ncbi:MAG: succinate dehydrogenase assembly factor 2 [Rhodospirillales bacterium]|nr:succinate dehydrogenase assembly factor 2 [Rhodospirillales bacterium]MCB9996059.1 succinate dehydrogenase assembly factor 2 [Rhodospirillales bacterium]